MTFAAPIISVLVLSSCALSGCKVLHKELDQVEFDRRVQSRFHLGMTHDQTSSSIRGMNMKPQPDHNDIFTLVFSRRLPLMERANELYFKFGDDDALDVAHYYPEGTSIWNGDVPHVIELNAEDDS